MNKRVIFVVDDEPDLLLAVSGFLEDAGFDVRAYPSGYEALEALEAGPPPDLVLLDVMMPGLSGWDVLERMDELEAARGVPVVVMSAVDPGPHRPHGRWKAFLKKPFIIDRLIATIERWS